MPTFEITSEHNQRLLKEGFTLLPNALPPSLLEHWRSLAGRMESDALEAHKRFEQLPGACVVEGVDGPSLLRYDDVMRVDPAGVLDLLACPAMMAVNRDMCGREGVPLQVDIVFKQPNPESVILWHQGATHPRGYPYLNVGIYLDDADPGDGCLLYSPGTQHELQDICGLSKRHGWKIPGIVELPAKAGDILVQDMMVLHGSEPKTAPGVRRTIYVEFRPVPGIVESNKQTKYWAELRKRWMALVLQRAADSEYPAGWRADMPTDLGSLEVEIRAILDHHEPPIPAVYCDRPIETDGYPIPKDPSNR